LRSWGEFWGIVLEWYSNTSIVLWISEEQQGIWNEKERLPVERFEQA